MIYVFEDRADDLLSELFMSAYSKCSFVYTRGNGNLVDKIVELLQNSNDTIMVFLDTIPDNKNTINVYNNLRRVSRKNNFRVFVMPIVCAEYYFIQSLSNNMFISHLGVDICKNKGYWKNSELIEDMDKHFVKNFEKFCKLILLKNVKDCAKHSRKDNIFYGIYYQNDCLCDYSDNSCKKFPKVEKAVNFVHQYPVFPSVNFLGECIFLTDEDLWAIHRKLVDDFNAMVDVYRSNNLSYAYSKISYIK